MVRTFFASKSPDEFIASDAQAAEGFQRNPPAPRSTTGGA